MKKIKLETVKINIKRFYIKNIAKLIKKEQFFQIIVKQYIY